MKRLLTLATLILVAHLSISEAVLLPAGTEIYPKGGFSIVLTESRFLLDRADMEAATLAMETVPIREAQIKSLEDLIAALNRKAVLVTVGVGVGSFAAGLLLGILVKAH